MYGHADLISHAQKLPKMWKRSREMNFDTRWHLQKRTTTPNVLVVATVIVNSHENEDTDRAHEFRHDKRFFRLPFLS